MNAHPPRLLASKVTLPTGPRVASSKSWKSSKGRSCINQIHFICPKAAATGIMSVKVPSVARMDTMVLSVIPYFSVGDWRPSQEARIAIMAEKSARLATQHAVSMGHHTCCFRDRHADRKRLLDDGVLGFGSGFPMLRLGLDEQCEDDMFAETFATCVNFICAWSPAHLTLIEAMSWVLCLRHQLTSPRERGIRGKDRSGKSHFCKTR